MILNTNKQSKRVCAMMRRKRPVGCCTTLYLLNITGGGINANSLFQLMAQQVELVGKQAFSCNGSLGFGTMFKPSFLAPHKHLSVSCFC